MTKFKEVSDEIGVAIDNFNMAQGDSKDVFIPYSKKKDIYVNTNTVPGYASSKDFSMTNIQLKSTEIDTYLSDFGYKLFSYISDKKSIN